MQTVYVIMGNDYPDAVFDNEQAANDYLHLKKDEEEKRQALQSATPIFWRSYSFPLQHEVPS